MCGGGVFLLAIADVLVDGGMSAADALSCLHGTDLDPGAVAATVEALALWADAHSCAAPPPRVTCGDGFDTLDGPWDIVIGNPPFRGQLRSDTVHDSDERGVMRQRFGSAASGYVDVAWLAALAAVGALTEGGVCVLVQPRSFLVAAHGAQVRERIRSVARLAELWVPEGPVFEAKVQVCAPVLVRASEGDGAAVAWSSRLATAEGVPSPALTVRGPVLGDVGNVVAGFRDQYYGLVEHVTEGGDGSSLVTSGLIAPGRVDWGKVSARFAKRRWVRPTVDIDAVARSNPSMGQWCARMRRPKVVVATQTRVVEAAADPDGLLIPVTPVVSVLARDLASPMVAAALSAPAVSVWMQHRLAGSGMSPGAMRLSAPEVAGVPLPVDHAAWTRAAALLDEGPSSEEDWARFGTVADRSHGIDTPIDWWLERVVAASRRRGEPG